MDATNATGTAVSATPIETITIDPSPKASPPKAETPSDDSITMPKAAFDARLAQAKKSALAELGVTNPEEVKAAISASKAAAEAQKTDAERAASSKAALEFAQAENQKLSQAVATMAEATLAGLTDAQRAAVIEAAGEDPAAQIRTYNAFKGTWAAPAAPQAAPPAAPAAAPPANTMPGKGTPNDNGIAGSAPDPKAIYAELLKTNPYFAPRYAAAHGINTSAS